MPYLLIEDGFADNPKIMGLSDKAFRLHMSALIYSARNLQDGLISEIALRSAALNSGIRRPNAVVNDLVSAGLWWVDGDGWRIHDYLKHNPSRVEIEEKRHRTRIRKRRYDSRRNTQSNASGNAPSNASYDQPLETPKGVSLANHPTGSPELATNGHPEPEAPTAENVKAVRELAAKLGIGLTDDTKLRSLATQKAGTP